MKRNLTFALFCGTLVPMAALAQERPNIIYIGMLVNQSKTT